MTTHVDFIGTNHLKFKDLGMIICYTFDGSGLSKSLKAASNWEMIQFERI